MVSEKLLDAIANRFHPQRIERIIRDDGFDIVRMDAPNGWFDLICVKDDKVKLVVRYQFWHKFGWYYDILKGRILKDVKSAVAVQSAIDERPS